MVVQKTIDNLKGRPQDERKVVAGGIAVSVVIVLLIGWGIMFLKKISSGSQEVNFDAGAQDEFNFTNVKEAQQTIEQSRGYSTEELLQIRNDAAAQQLQGQQQTQVQTDSGSDQFGQQTTSY